MTKAEITENMQTAHRQLERHIFYFKKQPDGVLRATERPKFNTLEMEEAGVVEAWSLKDLLAHLIEWEQKFVDWYHAGKRGEIPQTPAEGYSWRELDEVNRRIYEKHHDRTVEDVLKEFQSSYDKMLDTLAAISEEELFEAQYYEWTGRATLADYVAGCGYEHYDWAK
jgi:hypothetical protein